jgi:hypothetical protein
MLLPVLAVLSGLLAFPAAPTLAQGGLPQIAVPADLDADAIERYADKLDAYAQLLAGTSRTVTNALRYLKNFDLKSGPKGTERSTYDLVDLNAGPLRGPRAQGARRGRPRSPRSPSSTRRRSTTRTRSRPIRRCSTRRRSIIPAPGATSSTAT